MVNKGDYLHESIKTFCHQCGPNIPVDEDGCCKLCGYTATGRYVYSIEELRAAYCAALSRIDAMESEPRIKPDGCNHSKGRMIEWINKGACPVCITAELGINKEHIMAVEGEMCRTRKAVLKWLPGVANNVLSITSPCPHAEEAKRLREENERLRRELQERMNDKSPF